MDVQYIPEARSAIGDEAIKILTTIYSQTQPPYGIPAQRFRADYPLWISDIEKESAAVMALTTE